MTKKTPDSRRKLLKSIAAGSGAIVAGKSLPESWSKPVVNAILLPAHAETTDDSGSSSIEETTTPEATTTPRVCCEAVFCQLDFRNAPIGGWAAVSSDCTIQMEGGSKAGNWTGSGTVSADGSFSFAIEFENDLNQQVSGTVSPDCSTISGNMTSWTDFSGTASQGVTDPRFCEKPG